MPNTGEARRARRARQRRQAILESAARVFARRGFDKATTREIAREADISEGTIYNYFSSKEHLLQALAEIVQEEIAAVIPERSVGGDDRAQITLAVERVLELIADNAVIIRGLVTALWDRGPRFGGYLIPGAHRWIARVQEYLEDRIAAGMVRPCDVQIVARMVMGMVAYVAMPYLQGLEPLPSADRRRQQSQLVVSVLMEGLRVKAEG
jgi:AcrR family transcriptional regulator